MAKRIVSALGKFSNSTVTGNDDTFKQVNIAEYTVEKKKEGNYQLKRILFFLIMAAVFIGLIVLLYQFIQYVAIIVGFAFAGMGGWMLYFFLYRYLQIEYSYAIENSELICTEIYGNKSDKLLLRTRMSSVERVVPYEGEYKAQIDSDTYETKIELRSTPATDQAYAVVYKTENGGKGVVFLEATNKTLKAFKYYCSQNTVIKEMRR